MLQNEEDMMAYTLMGIVIFIIVILLILALW